MRKFLTIMVISIAFFFSSGQVLADDKSSDQYYQELLQNYRHYQSLVEPYNTQRSRHLTYKTVETQADFLVSAKDLASAEIDAMISYTSFVKTLLGEATRVLVYNEAYPYLMLDEELSFLAVDKTKINSLSSLLDVQTFLTDLAVHYKKIRQYGYQVKSIVEVGSINKNLENIKIESDKIENLLGNIQSDQAKIYAAKEKFAGLKTELQKTEAIINDANSKLKNPKDDYTEVSVLIRSLVNQSNQKFLFIISGYKNILYSLR